MALQVPASFLRLINIWIDLLCSTNHYIMAFHHHLGGHAYHPIFLVVMTKSYCSLGIQEISPLHSSVIIKFDSHVLCRPTFSIRLLNASAQLAISTFLKFISPFLFPNFAYFASTKFTVVCS